MIKEHLFREQTDDAAFDLVFKFLSTNGHMNNQLEGINSSFDVHVLESQFDSLCWYQKSMTGAVLLHWFLNNPVQYTSKLFKQRKTVRHPMTISLIISFKFEAEVELRTRQLRIYPLWD